jgi:hypothetical protein
MIGSSIITAPQQEKGDTNITLGVWYSQKHNGPRIRYEIGICIQTRWIIWVNGPFPCGDWPDLKIARECLIHMLDDGEFYSTGGGAIASIVQLSIQHGHSVFEVDYDDQI